MAVVEGTMRGSMCFGSADMDIVKLAMTSGVM